MRILVHVTDHTNLRHFWSVIRSLARRGHSVRIVSEEQRPDLLPPRALLGIELVSFIQGPRHRGDELGPRIAELRALRDYLRYLDTPFETAPKLRARALKKLVKALSDGRQSHIHALCPRCEHPFADEEITRMALSNEAAHRLDSLLALVESAIPSDPAIAAFLRRERPDLLIVTPLIKIGSHQPDYVKGARALGVPVVFPVFSWDNLSTKGRIHVLPDRVLVWNEWQRREAVELHQVPPDRVVVTGAPRFDQFFAMRPKVQRERFCRKRRLDPAQPIVTYLCSSNFVAGRERDFVVRWIGEIRSVPALAGCNVVIRPHPRHTEQWKKFRVPFERVALMYPRSVSVDQTLYDVVYHSAAVVALNTSAEVEAGIVGRPVLTLLAPEFAGGQEGTIHFRYLLKEHGGFVEVAADFEAHRRQLAEAVAGNYDAAAIRGAIERFVRPHGIAQRATPIMVQAMEEAVASGFDGHPQAARLWQSVRGRLAVLRRRTGYART